ncbi:MAG: PLP-dependent transferase, partial [Xanthomonadales bacterium]|nr:PLP-dependent transferase [Xanthomonadales bacterium]
SRQMRDFGGMLSIEVRGGKAAALEAAGRLRLFTNATSLGGCESLVEHRASVEGANPVSPANLLRLSVGLEHADDLVADLEAALA